MLKSVRKVKFVRHLLLPSWIRLHRAKWRVRNWLSGNRPVTFQAGSLSCQLNAQGEIAYSLYVGGFETVERDFVQAYIRPGMQVIDAGANIGLYTVLCSTLIGSVGRLYAFEPSRSTYDLLLINLGLNKCQNVSPNCLALSDFNGNLVLRQHPDYPYDTHLFVERLETGEKSCFGSEKSPSKSSAIAEIVECKTLDNYLRSEGVDQIDFLKLDVEGAELSVLQGARKTLLNDDLTLMMECTKNVIEVAELLMSLGYLFFVWETQAQLLHQVPFEEAHATGCVIARRHPWTT